MLCEMDDALPCIRVRERDTCSRTYFATKPESIELAVQLPNRGVVLSIPPARFQTGPMRYGQLRAASSHPQELGNR